jgi:hypothetical protein
MIQRCGKSGVELHEIRRNVDANGDDTTSKGKPINGYTDGKKGVKVRGFNANRPRSCGFGPSKPQINEKVPKLTETQKALLISIDSGTTILDPNNKVAHTLVDMDLIMWSDRDKVWKAMADGRRIADLLRVK